MLYDFWHTYLNYELLITDDCSSYGSVGVIQGYSNPRIRTFFLREHLGAVGILPLLLSQAEGTYIALLNSDDYWDMAKLSEQMDHMLNAFKGLSNIPLVVV